MSREYCIVYAAWASIIARITLRTLAIMALCWALFTLLGCASAPDHTNEAEKARAYVAIQFAMHNSTGEASAHSVAVKSAKPPPVVKPVLVIVTGPDCRGCRLFKSDYERDTDLARYINRNFQVEYEAPAGRSIPQFKVGDKTFTGYGEGYLPLLNWLKEQYETITLRTSSVDRYPGFRAVEMLQG